MKLGMAIKNTGSREMDNGTTKLHTLDLSVIDLNTGEELENEIAYLWGSKDILISGPNPILTPEYFEGDPDDASYVVLVFRCDNAVDVS